MESSVTKLYNKETMNIYEDNGIVYLGRFKKEKDIQDFYNRTIRMIKNVTKEKRYDTVFNDEVRMCLIWLLYKIFKKGVRSTASVMQTVNSEKFEVKSVKIELMEHKMEIFYYSVRILDRVFFQLKDKKREEIPMEYVILLPLTCIKLSVSKYEDQIKNITKEHDTYCVINTSHSIRHSILRNDVYSNMNSRVFTKIELETLRLLNWNLELSKGSPMEHLARRLASLEKRGDKEIERLINFTLSLFEISRFDRNLTVEYMEREYELVDDFLNMAIHGINCEKYDFISRVKVETEEQFNYRRSHGKGKSFFADGDTNFLMSKEGKLIWISLPIYK